MVSVKDKLQSANHQRSVDQRARLDLSKPGHVALGRVVKQVEVYSLDCVLSRSAVLGVGARPLFCKMIEQQFDSVILAMGRRRLSFQDPADDGRTGIGDR